MSEQMPSLEIQPEVAGGKKDLAKEQSASTIGELFGWAVSATQRARASAEGKTDILDPGPIEGFRKRDVCFGTRGALPAFSWESLTGRPFSK